jgi:hypothetical protein
MTGLITLLVVLGLALYLCWLMLQPSFNVLSRSGRTEAEQLAVLRSDHEPP